MRAELLTIDSVFKVLLGVVLVLEGLREAITGRVKAS